MNLGLEQIGKKIRFSVFAAVLKKTQTCTERTTAAN